MDCTCKTKNQYHSKTCPKFISPQHTSYLKDHSETNLTISDMQFIDENVHDSDIEHSIVGG